MTEVEQEKHLELYLKAHTFSKSKEPHGLSHIWKPASELCVYVNNVLVDTAWRELKRLRQAKHKGTRKGRMQVMNTNFYELFSRICICLPHN